MFIVYKIVMAQLSKQHVLKKKFDFCSIPTFLSTYHPGLSLQAVHYCLKQDKLDFFKEGRENFIVLSPKTLEYKPIAHPSR